VDSGCRDVDSAYQTVDDFPQPVELAAGLEENWERGRAGAVMVGSVVAHPASGLPQAYRSGSADHRFAMIVGWNSASVW